jgi:membrane-associated protein
MNYRTFLTFDIVGGILWGVGVTTLGYFLGQVEFVKNNIELILIGVVFVSVVPIVFELNKARRAASAEEMPVPFEPPIDEHGDPIKVDAEADLESR